MQQHAADFGSRLGHENACSRLPSHEHWQCPDVVLMTVRDQNRFNFPVRDRFEIRERIFAGILRMHSAIEHEAVPANLEIV